MFHCLKTVAPVVVLAAAGFAQNPSQPTLESLQQQVQDLRQQVNTLQDGRSSNHRGVDLHDSNAVGPGGRCRCSGE